MSNKEFLMAKVTKAVKNTVNHFANSNPTIMESVKYRNELGINAQAIQLAAAKTLKAAESTVMYAEISYAKVEHVIPVPKLRLIKGNKQ